MKNRLLPFLLICITSANSCSKIECTISNPFTQVAIANYKCAKDCKTKDELKQGFNCIRCTTSIFDTITTCDKALADSLYLYYQTNPNTGNCTQINPIVLCNK